MKKLLYLSAATALGLTACTSDEYIGEEIVSKVYNGEIQFSTGTKSLTRADIAGSAAADLLGRNFIVEGTKGTEAADAPTSTVVFDNYLVKYEANTAGTTESNSHNWEYVGVTGTDYFPASTIAGLSRTVSEQSIKYWDYSQPQYDFIAYSTGTKTAIASGTPNTGEVLVEKIATGTTLSSHAYSFTAPSVAELKECYITDIQEVKQADYGKVVTLKFKNLTSKIRLGIYETIPGYSVKDVKFYSDNTASINPGATLTDAVLFTEGGGTTAVLPASGKILVMYPSIGTDNDTKADYNKAVVSVTPNTTAGSTVTTLSFDALNYGAEEKYEDAGNNYLGRTLPTATMAGSAAAQYYQAVMPNNNAQTLTLRADYTLVSTDGSGEEIKVYGSKAVVPSTYTNWLPNYAYTYIFKISDNTNGWTSNVNVDTNGDGVPDGPAPEGLYPITFDAVVTEMTDFNAEQTTITTVAKPSITTYQQGHTTATNEYSKAVGNDIYVQVMDNSTVPATLVNGLNASNALLYLLGNNNATEALVMDALVNQSNSTADAITGRNGLVLTKKSNIDATVDEIINGVDDNAISITAGEAAMIGLSGLIAGNTYAFVYVQSAAVAANTIKVYQPVPVPATPGIVNNVYPLAGATITNNATQVTTPNAKAQKDMLYFSKTTNGTGTTTWSYVTVKVGETPVTGLWAIATSKLGDKITTSTSAVAGTWYFDVYEKNDGKYAVKVIKIVA